MATWHEKKKLWEARRRIKVVDGNTHQLKTKRLSFWAKTEVEAEIQADLAIGANPAATVRVLKDKGKVSAFVRDNVLPGNRKKSFATREQAAWAFNSYILPAIGNLDCEELQLGHCEYILDRVSDGYTWKEEAGKPGFWKKEKKERAPSTVKTVRKHLNRLTRLMARQKLIPYNYIEEIECPTIEDGVPVLNIYEAFSLWEQNLKDPMGPIVFMAAFLGTRRGETLASTSEDIADTFLVRHQRVYERGRGVRDKTDLKTETSDREIALPAVYQEILASYAKKKHYLCVNEDGEAYHPTSIRAILHTACRHAGLPECSIKSLRATFLTAMDEIGCPRGVARSIAGHGKQNVTDGYVKAREEAQRFWLDKLLETASTWPSTTFTPGLGVVSASLLGVKDE